MATEEEAKETISESQHIVQGLFYEALQPDAVGMFDSSKGKILAETPIDGQHSFKGTVSQHVNIVREELSSKGHTNEAKDEKVSDVKEQLVSETVDGNVTATDAEMTSDGSTGNKVDAQAEDKQDEAQDETDSEKLERVNEELSIKIEHETRSVNDESTTGTDSISGADPSQNENSREPVWMMTKKEVILGSPLDRVNEELHVKIEATTGILNDERTNDIDSMLVEEPSEKGNTQEPLEMTAKEDFEHTKDEPEHEALESSLDAVRDESEEFERVNEEKNANIEGEARIVDDERVSNDDSILVVEPSEEENKQESIDVAAARGLEPSQDVTESDKLESPLDAVPEDIKGLEGKCELETMSKELVVNVEERSVDDKKKCEPVEKVAFELLTVSENLQNMVSESSSETLIANKTNEKNTDDVGETTEGCEKHETATIEEMSRDADNNIDRSVHEIEPENLEMVPETTLEDQSHKKFDDAETTNFNIPEDGVNLNEEIDTLCTSRAAIEENTGKTMNTEETSTPDQPDEKNIEVRDDDTQNDEVIVKYEEAPNSVWEDQAHETRISKDDTEISEFNEKTSRELELVSELVPEQKIQETITGTLDPQTENPYIDKSSNKEVSVVANLNGDAKTLKESTEANLHAVEDNHSESRTVIVPVLPDQIGEQEDAPKTESAGQIYEANYGKGNVEADTHEEKADYEELEVITTSILNDHNQEDVKPKETDNPDHMDNLDKKNPEIADYSDDPGTTDVNDEDVMVMAISDATGPSAFVAEAANEEDRQITKTEDDKEAAVQVEKENLDINWLRGPEIQKDDTSETENAKIERALSLDKDAIISDARVEIASDGTSRLTLEETAVENNHTVESDDKLESSDVFETGEEEVLKKEESVDSTIALRIVNTTSAEVISKDQKEGKEGTPVTANSEIFRSEEKQKLEEAITEVASTDQSKEIYGADDNQKNGTSIEEISEMVELNEDKENIKNEANENKDSDEHTLSVQEAPKGKEGQKNGEGPSSVNEDQVHQPTYSKENIEVDISEAERDTEQFKLMPESLPEDKWRKEAGVFDAINIDSSTNDNNPNTTISVVANANEDVETAMENDEKNLNTDKEDHSDSHRVILPVLSDQIGEHENASKTEHQEHIYQANNDERNIEVDIHKEKAQSEEPEIIVESIPRDCNQEDVTEPKAEDISDHSDDLQKEIPDISGHNDSPETANVKDEDVLEKGICDVSDTHELVAETTYDGVDEKHEDAPQITNTEDDKEAAAQKEEENIAINLDFGPEPEDQRQDGVCEAERMRVELTLNIDEDDEGSDLRAENASEATSGSDIHAENVSEATSGLTLEERLAEKSYKLEYDDKTGSKMLEIRGEEVPMKEEVFDACLEASSNVVSQEPNVVEVQQVSREIREKEVETNGTAEEAKVADLVSQSDIETMDDNLYGKEASLDKKMQDVSVVVHQKIHSAEEDNCIEVSAILENQTKEEKEIHIRLQKDEMVDNQQEKENEAQAEQKFYESSNAGAMLENESFKDKETVENNSEEEKLEDNKSEKSPTVVLEDFEKATGANDNHECETYKQGMKDVSEEIFQKAEDMMLTESSIELGQGNQSNSSIHITEEEEAIPSKEALEEEALGACLGVSSHVEFKEPFMAEVEQPSQQLTEKEEATNGTDKEAKDAEIVSQMEIKTMGDILHANEDSRDVSKQDGSVEIEENIQNAHKDDSIEVSADSNNQPKEEKDAHTSLIKEDLKDMPQEKEIETEQVSYKSSEAGETNEHESFRYKETAEDISRDIEDQDPEKLPHVIGDLETASETKVIHVSEMEKQSAENNNNDFLKDEDMILVQSVTILEHNNQNNRPIQSTKGPIPSAEVSKEEVSYKCMGASSNPSCNDPTAVEVKHLSHQITEKEETTNGTDKAVNLKNDKDDELISRTDIETVGDSSYANETSHDKSMHDDSAVVEEKIQSSSEDKSTQTKGISENENKEKPDVQTSIQIDEPEDKKHKKVNELISEMDMETVVDSVSANEASHDKHMQDAIVVVDEKIHSSSEDKTIETMVILANENKEELDIKTSIQNDESKDKKQENDDEQISQTDMEIEGDFLYANEASHDKNMQDASVIVKEKIQRLSGDKSTELIPQMDMEIMRDSSYAKEDSHDKHVQDASVTVEEKIQSSSKDNSVEITDAPENENEEELDAQTNIQDDEPEDKKQEKGDELTSQMDMEVAGDSTYANEASRDKNMQDASEVVEEKLQSSSKDLGTETLSTLENENKEYLDVQTSIQKDELEEQEKENEIQAQQKCNESQDASDTIENECLKEKVIADNVSQKEMMDDQGAEKLPYVVHGDLETTTGAKAIDVTETEQEGAENKNDENVRKSKDVMPVELMIELEHGNQSNNSIYSTEEAPTPSEEVSKEEVFVILQGVSSGDGLSKTTAAEVKQLTRQLTDKEEEANGTDEEAKQAELLSQMDIQTMNNTSIANEPSFDTNNQDASGEIEINPHGKHEDGSTETRAISEIESNEEKDVHISLQKEGMEDKPPRKESEMQKEQEADESIGASEKNENQNFKDKVSADNYSEKENLEVQEPMKSPHVVLEDPETVTKTEDIHGSETEKQRKENSKEENFQKVEDVILVEPMFKLEPDNQDNKPNYTAEADIPDEETLKVFNACVEVGSKIESTEPIVDEVEHLSQEMMKKEELIDEEAKEVEFISQVYTKSMGDALYNIEASLSKNMQDDPVVVNEKILGTPEDNSIEVRAVSQNGNKEEQGVHTILQKVELQDKPIEKENGIQIMQKSYESGDVNETNKKDNFKYKETEEYNLEKEILEDPEPEKSPDVIDEDLETTRTEGIHESEAGKKGTEYNSEEYFQKAEDLTVPELATGIEPGNQSNYSIHTTEKEIPNEESLKDEAFDACQGESSNTGTREPTIAEVDHLSQQIIDKDETSYDTDEKGKEVELVSEMNTETRSVPSLQANEVSIDTNLQDSSLVVEEKTHNPSEDNSIEVITFSKIVNKEEQDDKKNLHEEEQEDMPQENEIEIPAEQKSYEFRSACETIENKSLKEKATTENNSVNEKLEDQESESPNAVHEETETAIGIHESETEKQVAENSNGENFLQSEEKMFAESVTKLDIGNEINKSIHPSEPEIPSGETLKEEVFDACQEMSFNTRLGKPIVAEIAHLSQDMAAKEAATNRTNEVDKNGEFVSQTDIEPMGDTSCSNRVSLETTMQDTSEVVEENMSMSDDSTIVRAILEDENKEEHAVCTSLQEEGLEVKTQEKEKEIPTEQKSHTLSDASETYGIKSFKEKESAGNNSENQKLENQEPEKSSQMVLEDLETANETEDIHGSETEKQDTESEFESEPDNTNNNSIHSTKGVAPIEEKTMRLIDDVKGNSCKMLGGISVTHELIEESKHIEGQGPILQNDCRVMGTHQKAEQRASSVTQNEVMADSTEILNIKLQEDVNEFMELDASADTLFRNQEITIAKNIVSEDDTIETVYEQIQKDESEAKKDEIGTDSDPNKEVKENDCQSLKQTTTMMDSSGNLGTSSLADETKKELDEKFSKISDYWPARYNKEASNVNIVNREHQNEITRVGGQPFGIDKFTFTSDSTYASKLDACREGRETLNEVSNLVSKEEIDENIGSSTVLTEGKKNPREQSAMQEPEVKQPIVMETAQVISNASHEIKVENLQEEGDDLPVSQFLMKHVLGEDGDTLNKNCEDECEDVTDKQDERDKKNEVDIPKQEETSKPEDNAGCEKLQNSYESPQTEESVDAENNSEDKVAKNDVTLQSAVEGSTSKPSVIEDEFATVLSDKSVHTAIGNSMELTSAENIIPEIKLNGKPGNETDLVQDEKIQASIFEKDIQKDILQKESDEESKEQLQNVGNIEVSEDKIGEILKFGSEIVECGEEKKDVGTQIHISKKDSEEDLKLSKSQENKQTDLGIESSIQSLKRDKNLFEDKKLAVMVETTDDKEGVNKTVEDKYTKEEMDEHKPEKSGNYVTTTESTDSELKPVQKDDQTKKSFESSITNDSKLNEILELRAEDNNEESADTTQDIIDKNQGQKKTVASEELKLSEPQIVQQSHPEIDEDHSMLSTEIKVDEDKTDDETAIEATDSKLKPIQKDDQTMKPFESSITDDSKLNKILELRSKDNGDESADKKQDVIHQDQGQMKNVTTKEQKLSESQIAQQSDPAMDEDRSVLSTESKVDEEKTDDENDEKEEEDEHKPEEPGHDAAITVESRYAEVTPTKKKSHGILSGVGSKVKHSIAKVKKAITGKSSHSKAPSAK